MSTLFHPSFIEVFEDDKSREKFDSLSRKLRDTQSLLDRISSDLDNAVADSTRETIYKLEIAMATAYDIAVFIRGNYDHRDVEETRKEDILHQTFLAFQETQNKAESGLRAIADFHTQVMEIQNIEISDAKNEIKVVIEQNEIELRSAESQIETTQQAVGNLQQTLLSQTQAVQALESRVASSKNAALASDIGFTTLGIGIGSLSLDPFNTHRDLDDARNRRNNAHSDLVRALSEFSNLTSKRMGLEIKLSNRRNLRMALPQLQSSASAVESRAIMLQSQFGLLKDTSSKLLLKIKGIHNDAALAEKTVLTKKEFATALLQICNDALIDSQLIEKVQVIKSEILTGWGGAIPDDIAEAGGKIDGTIELLKGIPSIKERL